MSITFRVMSTGDVHPLEPAAITLRELTNFCSFARANNLPMDMQGEDECTSPMLDFEVSICSIALGTLARIFNHDEQVIMILDEAQFTQRQVRFYKDDMSGGIMLDTASTIDGSINLSLATGTAFAVLEALDLPSDPFGEVSLTKLRDQLSNPNIRTSFRTRQIERYLPRLDKLAAIEVYQSEPQLAWG